jgi:SAM-dependent methyltransferase
MQTKIKKIMSKDIKDNNQEIKELVQKKYTEVVTADSSCCAPSCCSPGVETFFNESYDHLQGYSRDADYGLGCGIPTEFIDIQKGETVLDLGSGAGNDAFVAQQLVGKTGQVIGLDMTPAMIKKANENKEKLGIENVRFVLGDIEDMPLESESVDVVLSNCVMNLVPDKMKGYGEVYRVLKPGGRFSMSDIITVGELTPAVRQAAALYAGCVSGALQKQEYLDIVEQAGFKNIGLPKERKIELPDELLLQHLSAEALQDFRDSGASIYSITVIAEK